MSPEEMLIWGALLLAGISGVGAFFKARRARERRRWRAKRPIHVKLQQRLD